MKLITCKQAATILSLRESTFRERAATPAKAAKMGLTYINLNDGLPKGAPPLKDHIRFIESEVTAIRDRAVEAATEAAIERNRLLLRSLEKTG